MPPILLGAIALAVANRAEVTFSFDPFSQAASGHYVSLPLYGVIFIAMLAGILMGGAAAWLKQRK